MKYVLLFVTLLNLALACGGTCLECHPKLKSFIDDKEHFVLNQCVSCHDKPSQQSGACGQDCFACHNKTKLYADASIKEHQAIRVCYGCHKDTNISNSQYKPPMSSDIKPLVELLK